MYVLVAKKEAERILSLMKEISYYNQSAGGQAGQAGQAFLSRPKRRAQKLYFFYYDD